VRKLIPTVICSAVMAAFGPAAVAQTTPYSDNNQRDNIHYNIHQRGDQNTSQTGSNNQSSQILGSGNQVNQQSGDSSVSLFAMRLYSEIDKTKGIFATGIFATSARRWMWRSSKTWPGWATQSLTSGRALRPPRRRPSASCPRPGPDSHLGIRDFLASERPRALQSCSGFAGPRCAREDMNLTRTSGFSC